MKKLIYLCFLFLVSCKTFTPLTGNIVNEYKIGEKTIKRIQFYVSSDFILTRTYFIDTNKTENGKLITIKIKKIENIKIRKKTPCTVSIFSDNVGVSFNDKDNILYFFSDGSNYTIGYIGDQIQYGKYLYDIISIEPINLLCKRKHIFKTEKHNYKVTGKRL